MTSRMVPPTVPNPLGVLPHWGVEGGARAFVEAAGSFPSLRCAAPGRASQLNLASATHGTASAGRGWLRIGGVRPGMGGGRQRLSRLSVMARQRLEADRQRFAWLLGMVAGVFESLPEYAYGMARAGLARSGWARQGMARQGDARRSTGRGRPGCPEWLQGCSIQLPDAPEAWSGGVWPGEAGHG